MPFVGLFIIVLLCFRASVVYRRVLPRGESVPKYGRFWEQTDINFF
jgi:hypothetical protein